MTHEELLYRCNPWWEGEALDALRRQLTTPQVVLVNGIFKIWIQAFPVAPPQAHSWLPHHPHIT
ncbi:MAG: hypothetical protein HY318_12845 [Armatimonadetes bacterium]|nr:hypothetical protein [Armatimonadota bacterium]